MAVAVPGAHTRVTDHPSLQKIVILLSEEDNENYLRGFS
jgi:hypothetical protein